MGQKVAHTTMVSFSTWSELVNIVAADNHTGPWAAARIHVAPADARQLTAIEHAYAVLDDMDAQPLLDVELGRARGILAVTLRAILADPVMAPRTADALTDVLQAAAGGPQRWSLCATDSGRLRWELDTAYTAILP
ncbi:hypothetical protein AFM11_30080 [Mycolicibacterium wolinskyi]|uniref:Uncharacterized protein n=1 Tax=Mycolicibacterium wolinskyi TaxID=59750 RepID=A0A132PDY2_9MYCO|nr:hypothetical protein [Mycolicibacterium wolinskyi]KWX20437.1 hypothetical protein AFM11_30080 [Mycolicibacterium wolinskyi]